MDKVSEADEMAGLDPARIKQAIQGSAYSAAQVADRLGKSVDLVYRWQQGSRRPRLPELRALGGLTRQPLDFFFGVDAPAPPPPTAEEAIAVLQAITERERVAQERADRAEAQAAELKMELENLRAQIETPSQPSALAPLNEGASVSVPPATIETVADEPHVGWSQSDLAELEAANPDLGNDPRWAEWKKSLQLGAAGAPGDEAATQLVARDDKNKRGRKS